MGTDPAARLRLIKARAQGTLGLFRLLYPISRGRIEEVWVGDSNAVLFATHRFPVPPLSPGEGRRFVWHLGPRLMYSIANNGFPPVMLRIARLLARIPAARRVTWLFSFGEIDVRCHLAAHPGELRFVERYVDRVRELAATLRVQRALVVTSTPPSPDGVQHESFPVVGSIEQRLDIYRRMVAALAAATRNGADPPLVRLFDVSGPLADDRGCFRRELTYDGTHPNDAGREVIRREFARQFGSA